MLLSGKCCSQIFNLNFHTVETVLHDSARLLGLDHDEVLRSATLMHGASVVTDLKNDLEAIVTKFGPPPPLPPSKMFFPSKFSVHVAQKHPFTLEGFSEFSRLLSLENYQQKSKFDFMGCGVGGGGSEICCEVGKIHELTLVMS